MIGEGEDRDRARLTALGRLADDVVAGRQAGKAETTQPIGGAARDFLVLRSVEDQFRPGGGPERGGELDAALDFEGGVGGNRQQPAAQGEARDQSGACHPGWSTVATSRLSSPIETGAERRSIYQSTREGRQLATRG